MIKNKDNKTLVADIYREVCQAVGIELDDSHRKLLNKRLSFFLKNVAIIEKSEIKDSQNKMYVPNADAAIIRNLLYVCETEAGEIIVKWINGSWDVTDPDKCILLDREIGEPIRRAEMTGETDSVTVDEWISTIRCLTGYEFARQACALDNQMRKLRENSLGTRTCVNFGTIYTDDGEGHREYAVFPTMKELPLDGELLETLVSHLCTANDYYVAMNQITEKMIEKMECDIVKSLKKFAAAKSLSETDKIFSREDNDNSLVSDYVPYYNKLADYCRNHPEKVKEIEKEAKIENLEDFLRCN